jgi:adenylate cyclase
MRTARLPRNAPNRPGFRASALLGLQKVDVFKRLDEETLRAIADQCRWTRYKRNQYVIRRDGTDRDVYFVIAGMVRVTAETGRGRRIIFRDVPAGELFGEHSAIDGRARFADVMAVHESLLASMSPEAFRALLANHASVRERVLRRLTRSVRELADQVLDLRTQRVPKRIWAELLRLARLVGVEANTARIERPPPHHEIASHVGTSREQVSRELSRLDRDGILARDGRALVLHDIAALERLVADARVVHNPDEPITEEASHAVLRVPAPRQRRAVLVAEALDAVGMMERDEERTVRRWRAYLAHAMSETIPTHTGRSFSTALQHGFLAEFPDGVQALECAFELHRTLARFSAERKSPALGMRIGIHVADVIVEEFSVVGDGVNIAAGLAELANSGETVVSVQVRDQLTNGLDGSFEDLGEQRLRSRERAVRAFRVWPTSIAPAGRRESVAKTHGRPSIAVIPFRVLSSDPGHEMLGDGLAEETIAALSRAADFFVVSRLSSMAFRERAHSAPTIGRLLGAQYVVSGSLQTSGLRALLLAELADTRDGSILWSERFEGNLVDLFAMQADLARMVVNRVAPYIRTVELRRASITNFEQLDAFGLLLRGIELMHKASHDDFMLARQVLEMSSERDPTSAFPYAWLANWHVFRVALGASPDSQKDSNSATNLVDRALQRDPAHSVALTADGLVAAWFRHDLDATERRVTEALKANPNEPLAWLLCAGAHAWRGRGAEAVSAAEHAMSLSPLDPLMYFFTSVASTASLVAGHYDKGIELATQSLRANRLHTPSLRALAVGHVLSGDIRSAKHAVRKLRELEPTLTVHEFRDRYPGRDSPQADIFARALLTAGLPA